MGLFQARKVKNIINRYNNNLFNELNNNINILIDAFTLYYGEEYRNIITEKINHTYFFTFISSNIVYLLKEGYNKLNSDQKEIYKDFKTIIDYYKSKKHISKFFEANGSLTGNFKKQIQNEIRNNNDCCAFQSSNIDIDHNPIYTVFFGIGINDQAIIHELNHVITNSILAYIKGYDSKIEMIEKIGTTNSLSMETGEALEELLNDKSADDITNIFYKLGGKISSYSLCSINFYSLLFPLIDNFYDKYYDLIKKSRISDNQNLLYKEIDKQAFENYQEFISNEINYVCKNHKISPNSIYEADELVKKSDNGGIMNLLQKLKADKNINNYNRFFLEQINSNLKVIVEAFVKYYGEEYREIITERIKTTNIYTYISNCTIEAIYNTDNITNELKEIFNVYNDKYFAKILTNEPKIDNFYKKQIINSLSSSAQITGFHIFTFNEYNEPIRNVFVALFSNTQNLIHELNHTITSEVLALEMINDDPPATIVRNGIALSYASNHHKPGNSLEEIINDKISFEITEIFNNLGGNISTYQIEYPNTLYSELFIVIDKFYNKYKELLKNARITGNTNILFTKIRKDKFIQFQKMIDECLEIVASNKRVPFWVADNLISEMNIENCKGKTLD